MRVKPQIIYLWAVTLAALLSYGIVTMILAKPFGNKENVSRVIENKTLPPVTFYDRAGKELGLERFRGKAVLVNLWATWCTPCVAELPALGRVSKQLGGKLEVVAINLDRKADPQQITAFLAKHEAAGLSLYLDRDREIPAAWSQLYQGLPTSFLLDPVGNIVETFNGPFEWDKPEILARLEAATK
ncbi:MAG TPA: TlpA disulfide reductase family protein [Patescibacteria group bacterium]|nr:TlpA disulfide reductase family protein [Patescibacteria group bacterium]